MRLPRSQILHNINDFVRKTQHGCPRFCRVENVRSRSKILHRNYLSTTAATRTTAKVNLIQDFGTLRSVASNKNDTLTSRFSTSTPRKSELQRGFVPRKAAIKLSDNARRFCKLLLKNAPDDVIGIVLKYQMSTAGQMKMVFAFDFARQTDISKFDEAVSLELLEDGSPKPPSESDDDGLPKLHIHETAFMKVLGGTLDVDIKKDGSFTPILYDREGNILDPNV